jgi:hypothetical protein
VGWLVASIVLVALSLAVFAGGLRGLAVEITVVDDAVVGWLAGLGGPGLEGTWRALASLASWWVLNALAVGLLVVLLALRRFRHLIVVVLVANLQIIVHFNVVGPITQRPRPFGVVIREGWGGWAMLGADAPTDVLVGVATGVAIPLILFRLFTPTRPSRSPTAGAAPPT